MSNDNDAFQNDTKSTDVERDTSSEAVMAEDVAGAREAEALAGQQLSGQQLADELQAANERALRAQAELENFRKRMRREAEEERRYATLPLLTELLPVLDNLDRAIASGENNPAAAELVAGVKMVKSQFLTALERTNCRPVGQVGEPFDPHVHQAIAQEPSAELPAGTVTRVARSGYRLHDRVVRPAEVLVSTGDATAQPG